MTKVENEDGEEVWVLVHPEETHTVVRKEVVGNLAETIRKKTNAIGDLRRKRDRWRKRALAAEATIKSAEQIGWWVVDDDHFIDMEEASDYAACYGELRPVYLLPDNA